ncbi:MAG: folylpolyglutamate synthase/dihydrofolate synthase family protein [Pseudomonadota bacterium]
MNRAGSDIILQKMMSLHPKVIDLTLDRMWRLLDLLGNPQNALPPVIHAAGTNGKGSTLAMIRAGLEGAGQSAHAYTSPHLARFHERIRIAGDLIDEAYLAELLEECWAKNNGEAITYFEITTVAAFLAYARNAADWTLLETGLGGRLDATNVVPQPRLTVITQIDYDHQQFLGETLTEIAGEKAGILKRGVPCIVSPQPEEAMTVIEARAQRVGAPLIAYGQHWHVSEERGRLIFQDETGLLDLPAPNLMGPIQFTNAGTALAALRHLGMGEAAYDAAMTRAEWPARMQRLKSGPVVDLAGAAGEVWLDGGHNPAAGRALAAALRTLPPRDTVMICGMLKTKDIAGYLRPLAAEATQLYAVAIPGETATLSAAETRKAAEAAGIPAHNALSVEAAAKEIFAQNPSARILIAGSLYLAGSVLQTHA